MNKYKLKYKPFGSIAVLIEWPKAIEEGILKNISIFRSKIHTDMGEYVLETVPAYNSLAVFFDTSKTKYSSVVKDLREVYESRDQKLLTAYKLWRIPVCYDPEFGIDLALMSKKLNLSTEEIVQLHSSAIYDIFFIGFLPGFLYLGGMDEKLVFPRRDKPRPAIRKGDVGIAGNQTGVYPNVSPGGWNIIGNSPLNWFNVKTFPPCFAVGGDKLQFYPIDLEDHHRISTEVEKGSFQIENEVYG